MQFSVWFEEFLTEIVRGGNAFFVPIFAVL